MRKPKHIRDLEAAGVTLARLNAVVGVLSRRGVNVTHVRGKGWQAWAFGQAGETGTVAIVRVWLGEGALIDYLGNPAALVRDMHANGADVKAERLVMVPGGGLTLRIHADRAGVTVDGRAFPEGPRLMSRTAAARLYRACMRRIGQIQAEMGRPALSAVVA